MNERPASRIEEARRRAVGAKQAAIALAGAGFLAVVLLARGSHPVQAATPASSGSGSSSQSSDESSEDSFDFGSGSIAPSSSEPQAQTSVS